MNRINPYLWFFLLCLAAAAGCHDGAIRAARAKNADAIVIVETGQALAEIVIPDAPTEAENASATLVADYVQKISGATLSIRHESEPSSLVPIYIGNCTASKSLEATLSQIHNDGYVIEVGAKAIFLRAKVDYAVRFAAAGFLEDLLGVRWFLAEVFGSDFPANMGTHIPSSQTISLSLSQRVEDPAFSRRYISATDSNEWAWHNRQNRPLGSKINRTAHTFSDFLNPKVYFDHPDWFAMRNGRLSSPEDIKANTYIKMNTANPEAKEEFIKNLDAYMSGHPNVDVVNVFPSDWGGFDESPASKALDGNNAMNYTVEQVNQSWSTLNTERSRVLSRRMTLFNHDVADAILPKHQDQLLMFGAYSQYLYAPLEADALVADNKTFDDHVMLLMCHWMDHNHPLEDRSTEENFGFANALRDWHKIYKRFGVYEYYNKSSWMGLPFPVVHSVQKDIPYYAKNGVELFYTQYALSTLATNGLLYYLAAKLDWNPNTNLDALLHDYYEKFYGPAAEPMQKYFERLENAASTAASGQLVIAKQADLASMMQVFTESALSDCAGYLAEAQTRINDDATLGDEAVLYHKRIELSETSLAYTQNMMAYLRGLDAMRERTTWAAPPNTSDLADAQQRASTIRDKLEHAWKPYRIAELEEHVASALNPLDALHRLWTNRYPLGFQKEDWLRENHIDAGAGYNHAAKVDIWIAANGVSEAEHDVYLVNKLGVTVKIGTIGAADTALGNIQGFVISNIDLYARIGDDSTVNILITNRSGGSTTSTVYNVAIMPHDSATTDARVADAYETDVAGIRQRAVGFVETKARSTDPTPAEFSIALFDHEPLCGDSHCTPSEQTAKSCAFDCERCVPENMAFDICDHRDNNCNGQIDEDCR